MKYFALLIATAAIVAAGFTTNLMAGHHYHGHGCGFGMQDLTGLDANQDGSITLDEFSEPHMDNLKRNFKMLDTNNNELIDEEEWKQFLKWHGIESDLDTEPTG